MRLGWRRDAWEGNAMFNILERGKVVGLLAIAAVVLVMGCRGTAPATASSTGDGGSGVVDGDGAGGGSYASGGTQVKYISDPTLELNAIAVTLPAGWKFQSVFMQGGTCVPTPFGVYRSASADGWSMVERMPSLAWMWGTGPMVGYMQKSDCLPVKGPLSAEDFLRYLTGPMSVHYDGPAPVPAAEEEKAQEQIRDSAARLPGQFAAIGAQQPQTNRELARALVSYTIGTTAMKGMLDVTVDCTETSYAGQPGLTNGSLGHPPQTITGQASTVNKCVASTTYYTAPAEKLAALVERWDSTGLGTKPQQEWVDAWIRRNNEQTGKYIRDMNDAAARRRQALAAQFQESMATQQYTHDQFMQTMQQSHEQFMAQQQASQSARSTAASDWVDFALDRQTVINPNNGVAGKIPNAVSVQQPLVKADGDGTPW